MIELLESCTSTNTVLAARHDAPHGTVVATHTQTAGRGQRGNSWEAEPGKNLTFSMLLRPAALQAAHQFELSMVVSLAIADAIDEQLSPRVRTTIKWPNDIYIGAEKVCGILIENRLAGMNVEQAIAGVGINVNQQKFLSDAPNPTSIIHHNEGQEIALEPFLNRVCGMILDYWADYEAKPDTEALSKRYFSRLLWTSGEHPFADADGTFDAHIEAVDPDGILHLSNGRSYAFKEVSFLIPKKVCN